MLRIVPWVAGRFGTRGARLFMVVAFAVAATSLQAKTVTLGMADNRTDVALNLGDTLVVGLPAGTVKGFDWVSHLPKDSVLTPMHDDVLPAANGRPAMMQFRFNAARVGDVVVAFGFESALKVQGAALQDTSAYSVKVHVASGVPSAGTAILFGVYKGTLPCADCSGLDTTIRLYAKGKFDTTYAFYVRTQTYRGAPKGDVTFTDRGDWAVLRGDAVNPDATVYQLNPDDAVNSQAFLLQGNSAALVQLDREMRPLDSKLNFTLKRANQSQ